MRPSIVAFAVIALTHSAAIAQQGVARATPEQRQAALRAQWAAHPRQGVMTEPSVSSGKILTPDINVSLAPGAPRIVLNINPGTVGFSFLSISMASPDNQQAVSVTVEQPEFPPNPKKESLTIQVSSTFAGQGFGIYTEPGAWTINQITLFANDGSLVSYNGPQLSALFPSVVVNVTNPGVPDVTPPVIRSGKVLTPTISLSSPEPFFAATLKVMDKNSGVANVNMEFTPPSGTLGYGAYATELSPVNKGKVTASMLFPPSAPTGTYTISNVSICDVAGNCTLDSTPAEVQAVLGTTTFQVTN